MSIQINNLSYQYGDNKVLNDLNIKINKGEWISIVGHNGSGKSTLTKILCTLLDIQTGEIIVDDTSLNEENLLSIRRKFGVVFQNPDNQFVGATVFDDVAFGLQNLGVPREEIFYTVDKYLELVSMKNFKNREPHTLSGGQKQRVAIASALALEPEYLIFDEATSMLDPNGKNEIIELIKYLNDNTDTTIISITHDLNEAILGDRIIALNNGIIVFDDLAVKISSHIELFYEIGLDVPFILRLSNDLVNKGVKIDKCLFEEELIDKLWQLNLSK